MESVKLIECPRDAWQGLPRQIPTARKVEYLRALVAAGFRHIDAVSFVSPKAVPQMADSEAVLEQLDGLDGVEIIGIVVNEKGAARAIATGEVKTLGYPCSISETFLRRNQNQSPEENQSVSEEDQGDGGWIGAGDGRLHFHGVRQSVWRFVERRESRGSGPSDLQHGHQRNFSGGYRRSGRRRNRFSESWRRCCVAARDAK